jgi:hypothetical protein
MPVAAILIAQVLVLTTLVWLGLGAFLRRVID